jgi:signal transduction histidine kinase
MSPAIIYRATEVGLLQFAVWVRQSRLATKLAIAASICVTIAAMYAGVTLSASVRDNILQHTAAGAALYMDSFVASHVQELATKNGLSAENREALETLLSPASMHRPIVAFRIWKGDTIVFSNERALIGKTFPRSHSREQALQGHIDLEFDHPDGDDDEQVRSLKVPILEVYAPVRQKGTGRIIAIAQTYEIAIDLKHELGVRRVTIWTSIVAVALTFILLLMSMAGVGRRERRNLFGQIAEGERKRRKIATANMNLTEINERSLRRVETDLQHGPVQNVTLALLKLDPDHWAYCNTNGLTVRNVTQCMEDIEAAREALSETIRQMKGVCTTAVPARIAELSPSETLALAAREHYRSSNHQVEHDFANLPGQLPLQLKACLFRIALEGLQATTGGKQSQQIRCSHAGNSVMVEIVGATGGKDKPGRLVNLQDRIDALGGTLTVQSSPEGQLSLTVELNLSHMGIAVG